MHHHLPSGPTFRLRYAACPAPPPCADLVDIQLLPGERGDSVDCERDALAAIREAIGRPCLASSQIETVPGDRFVVTYIGRLRVWCRDLRADDIAVRRIMHRAVKMAGDEGVELLLSSGRLQSLVRQLLDAACRSPAAANYNIELIEEFLATTVASRVKSEL